MKYWLQLNDSGVWGDDPTGQDDVSVIRSTDIRLDGGWDLSDVAQRALSPLDRVRKRLAVGDLVVVKSSGSAEHLGKTAIVDDHTASFRPCFANFVQRLRPGSAAEPRYMWYLLNANTAASEMELLGNTTTGLRNLSGGTIGSVTFPGPPLPMQRAIADVLDAETARIDALVATKRKLIARIRERRTAVTAISVTGVFTSPDESRVDGGLPWCSPIPASWPTARLSLVAKLGSGHTPSRSHPEWWEDATIPWITTGEVSQLREDRIEFLTETREMVSESGIANSSAEVHPAGTVVLSRTASAGFSAIMGADMATSQDFVTWTCGPLLEPRFLLLCLRAMRPDLLGRLAQGSTHKTIYMPDVESIRVPLPPMAEQRAIVSQAWDRLKPMDETIDVLGRQIDLLYQRRHAFISSAVTGGMEIGDTAA